MANYYNHITPDYIKRELKVTYKRLDDLRVRLDDILDAYGGDKAATKKFTPKVNGSKNLKPCSAWDTAWHLEEVMSDAEYELSEAQGYFDEELEDGDDDFDSIKSDYVSVDRHYTVHLRELEEVLTAYNEGYEAFINRAALYFTLRGRKFKQANAILGAI